MFALSGIPDRAVAMLAANLGLVKTVVDLDRIAEGSSGEEAQRRRRLTKLLVERDPKVKLAIGVRRAISLLERLGTPAAIDSLKKSLHGTADGPKNRCGGDSPPRRARAIASRGKAVIRGALRKAFKKA